MKSLPFGIGLALAVLVSAIILGAVNTRSDLQTLHTASQESILWSAAQLEREYTGLQIEAFRLAKDPKADAAPVRRRFGSLLRRASAIREGQIGDQLMQDTTVRGVHERLDLLLTELKPVVAELPDGQSIELTKVTMALKAFESELSTYLERIFQLDRRNFSALRDSMREGMLLTAAALALTLIVATALTFLAKKEARRSTGLAEAAISAASSRKQFFSMMSHELRTPLNGILGSLALMREEDDPNAQKVLIEEAHASTHRLSHLINDAVDLNADEELELQPKLFRINDFVDSIHAFLTPQLRRRGAELSISGMTRSSTFLKCDCDRLIHALSYIVTNALQRGGTHKVSLHIALDGDQLSVEVGTDVMLPHDAFGETLAREIIGRLGGKVMPRETKRVITVPIEKVLLSAKLSFSSKALLRMYEALLNAHGVNVYDGTEYPADIILAEAAQEEHTFSQLREQNPNAVLIACGIGPDPSFFDEIARTPDDLMRAIHSALEKNAPDMKVAA